MFTNRITDFGYTGNFILTGSCEVGKSSIYLRYTKNQFDYSYQPTLSVNIINITKKCNIPADTLVSLTLWDMPGEEDTQLRRSYYKDLDAAVGKLSIILMYFEKTESTSYLSCFFSFQLDDNL